MVTAKVQLKASKELMGTPRHSKIPDPVSSPSTSRSPSPEGDMLKDDRHLELIRTLALEVEELLVEGLPNHVTKLSKPYTPSHQLNKRQYVVPISKVKPWEKVVLVDVSLKPTSTVERYSLYSHGVDATLQFNQSYLSTSHHQPQVWFQTKLYHPLITHELVPETWDEVFFEWFRKEYSSEGRVTVLSVLEYLNVFLFLLMENRELLHLPPKYKWQINHDAVIDAYESKRKHKKLFETPWHSEYFNCSFLKHFCAGSLKEWATEIHREVFTLPIFSNKFCSDMVEEMENFVESGLPVSRPNSMNNYGLIMNNIGLQPAIKWFQENYLLQIARVLFSNAGITSRFDSHHTFIVHYQPGKDLGLDMHTDDSDITFNVCLGKEFEGAKLNFCGVMGHPDHRQFQTEFGHVKGSMIVHLGMQRHGACEIESGERLNLIIWNKNQIWRKSKNFKNTLSQQVYRKEKGAPDIRCLSYTHDKDYMFFKKKLPDTVNEKTVQFAGWCPPEHAWYDEFAEERKELGIK